MPARLLRDASRTPEPMDSTFRFLEAHAGRQVCYSVAEVRPLLPTPRVREALEVGADHPLKLIADLRAMGETNALVDRARQPLTRPVLARAFEIYRERFGLADGRIPATFDIVALTGWAPAPSQPQPLRPGSAKMRLADALKVVEHRIPRE